MSKQVKKATGDAGANAANYYEQVPSSKVGEFSHADARVADLNAKTSTETRRTGDGVAAK